jgi:hypothetical protein
MLHASSARNPEIIIIIIIAVGVGTGYELDGREVGIRVVVGSGIFCTSSRVALGPSASCPVGTGGKAAEEWSWPLTSN